MEIINKNSTLWSYLGENIQGLVKDGEKLLDLANPEGAPVSDYSYLVFPFSKAYEGFLKKLFLDTGVISEKDFLWR